MPAGVKRGIVIVERKLGRERAYGQAIVADRLIEIDPRQTEASYLDTLIHEALHLLDPGFSEEVVTRYARVIAGLVRRAGYRRALTQLLPTLPTALPPLPLSGIKQRRKSAPKATSRRGGKRRP